MVKEDRLQCIATCLFLFSQKQFLPINITQTIVYLFGNKFITSLYIDVLFILYNLLLLFYILNNRL
ncbi:hypothetical protein SAMN05660206_101127 [Sphingobacterium wenxiniae]|uniref:Uncharacterized protein n=1 Tax=Sphingobacterium wenxiniae TaxID=683125 RepID=A0A1I6NVP3_9SPHI|nr:hypothetical protein SAMN05660206_101127 [Sphingobacterium wenxiniae]